MDEFIELRAMPLIVAADGPIFTEPGTYLVVAQLGGVDGTRIVQSPPAQVRIRVPDRATERVAEAMWTNPLFMEALYLRHPLVALEAWHSFEETLASNPTSADNTTSSYVNYVAGLGWMHPFDPGFGRPREADTAGMERRFKQVNPEGLPANAARRVKGSLKSLVGGGRVQAAYIKSTEKDDAKKERTKRQELAHWTAVGHRDHKSPEDQGRDNVSRPGDDTHVFIRRQELARSEVPPGGLFGATALGGDPAAVLDPWARVVPSLRGKSTFADVVSWNIEHLHSNEWKIPHIAELMRDMRCDFWGLQEVDAESVALLTEAINSAGSIRYDYLVVDGPGQQSGCLFRTDTTRVHPLTVPNDIFGKSIDVDMIDGSTVKKKVFLRAPLLCEVSVRQSGGGVFDFRTAIVHLKSTDTSVADKGNKWRVTAAKALAAWITADQSIAGERDYLVMGDMNAETAQQGLGPLSKDHRLLTVGMQTRYGKEEALTRVASKRLLDHIVITSDAVAHMPAEDIEEQLIIRTDSQIANWTSDFSDHVPVAVRFVLGKDAD
jgi:endonuclease/exonuclease/phosphatase family metal-dependent hydrolase